MPDSMLNLSCKHDSSSAMPYTLGHICDLNAGKRLNLKRSDPLLPTRANNDSSSGYIRSESGGAAADGDAAVPAVTAPSGQAKADDSQSPAPAHHGAAVPLAADPTSGATAPAAIASNGSGPAADASQQDKQQQRRINRAEVPRLLMGRELQRYAAGASRVQTVLFSTPAQAIRQSSP